MAILCWVLGCVCLLLLCWAIVLHHALTITIDERERMYEPLEPIDLDWVDAEVYEDGRGN